MVEGLSQTLRGGGLRVGVSPPLEGLFVFLLILNFTFS